MFGLLSLPVATMGVHRISQAMTTKWDVVQTSSWYQAELLCKGSELKSIALNELLLTGGMIRSSPMLSPLNPLPPPLPH